MNTILKLLKEENPITEKEGLVLGGKLIQYILTKDSEDERLMLYEMIGSHFEEEEQKKDWIMNGAKSLLNEDSEIKLMSDGINMIRLYTEVLRNNLDELINLNFDSPEVKDMIKTLKELLVSFDEKNNTKEIFSKTSFKYN